MAQTRKITSLLIRLMDEGIFTPRTIADCCLHYMSEDDVRDMAQENGILDVLDLDEDEEV